MTEIQKSPTLVSPEEIPTHCEKCLKPLDLCICEEIRSQLTTRLHILILQHPQEPDKNVGTALMSHLFLSNSTLKIGLSWPNLKAALGKDSKVAENLQPSRWAVLYLGSGVKSAGARGSAGLQFVNKKGEPLAASILAAKDLDGLVILDGTWSQAKTLWWRNAWLLKLKRAVLIPKGPSLYKELRKEPRKECLSTIESIGESLTALGESAEIEKTMKKSFGVLLDKQRARYKNRRPSKTE